VDSEDKTSFVLTRLLGVAWFFLCVFGATAALGIFFNMVDSPDAATYLQLGFRGGMGTLVGVGPLKLAQAFVDDDLSVLQRVTKASVFVLCLCGAAVALGIYLFEFQGRTSTATLLLYSLLSAAVALFVTGFLKLSEVYVMSSASEDSTAT